MGQHLSLTKIPKIYIFDIDDTLYAPELEYGKLIGNEMQKVMSSLDAYNTCTEEELEIIQSNLLQKYGTSIAGIAAESKLMINSQPLTYEEVYNKLNTNLEIRYYYSLFRSDPNLYNFINKLILNRCKIFCFTNGDHTHAKKILSKLKIYDILYNSNKDFLISFDTFNSKSFTQDVPVICKNKSDTHAFSLAFTHICKSLKLTCSKKVKKNIIFFDDSYNNIKSARKFGFNTVYVCKYDRDNTVLSEILPQHKILFTQDYSYESLTDDYQYCQIPYFLL
jgi:FMN phosphatase YigB (HAD superfamily)